MTKCQPDVFILLKGYSSRWDGVDWMSITFNSDTKVDFTGFSAKFRIGNYTFTNNDLSQEWIINLTDEQAATLPLGPNTASLIVYDTAGEGKPFTTSIPVLVKDWVDGDVTVDTYKATITATLDNKKEFIVNVETAKVSLEWVEGKIAEHNASESAHPYIRNLISSEEQARKDADLLLQQSIANETHERELADTQLNNRISTKQDKLTSENAGTGISIEDVGGKVVISNTQTSAEWGRITGDINDQTDLQEEFATKQDTLIAGENITIIDNVISSSGGISNLDGGSASTIYLNTQKIDGGDAEGD